MYRENAAGMNGICYNFTQVHNKENTTKCKFTLFNVAYEKFFTKQY